MLLYKIIPLRVVRLALLAAAYAVGHSGNALALSCTPGVSIASSGFTLGCATPALWAVLAVNQPAAGGTTLDFKGGSGTYGSTAGMQVGIVGGNIKTTSTSQFSGNIVVTDGIFPSAQATDTNNVSLNSSAMLTGSPAYKIAIDDALLLQARADAISSVSAINTYVTNNYAGGQHFDSGISAASTITATHGGLNLITVGTSGSSKDINLDGSTLAFSTGGFADVQFLVEVTGSLKLNHGAQVNVSGTGLVATDVLFDIETGGALTMDNGSSLSGIVLDAGGSGNDTINHSSVLYGELIGGAGITLDNASSVKNKSAPFGCTVNDNGSLTCTIRTAPEPGTIALLALGLLGIFGARVRMRDRRFATPVPA